MLQEDGTPDTSVGTDAALVFEPAGATRYSRVQRLYVHGSTLYGAGLAADDTQVIARVKSDFSLDDSFGDAGFVTFSAEAGTGLLDLLLDGDGRVVAAGTSRPSSSMTSPRVCSLRPAGSCWSSAAAPARPARPGSGASRWRTGYGRRDEPA